MNPLHLPDVAELVAGFVRALWILAGWWVCLKLLECTDPPPT